MARCQVVTAAFSGGPYFSTIGYTSLPTDTPASTSFQARIKGSISYEREVGCSVWRNSGAKVAIGSILLLNTDGGLDAQLAEQWRDRIGTLQRGLQGESYDGQDHVAYVVVDSITTPDQYRVELKLRDKGALLDVGAQQSVYGAIALVPELEGTPKPFGFGTLEGVPLTLVETEVGTGNQLDFDLLDETPTDITEVTDEGVILAEGTEWEESPAAGCFGVRLLQNPGPGGKQVAALQGPSVGSMLIEQLPDVIAYLLNRSEGRVYPDEVDPYSIDALNADAPYKLCWWCRDATTISSILTQVLDSFTGWWYFDRLGQLRVGRLVAPDDMSESAVVELTPLNIKGGITPRLDTAPGLSDAVTFARNWSPYEAIASGVSALEPARAARIRAPHQVRRGVNVLHPTYRHAVGADPIPTCLSDGTDAQAEADRLTALYSVERYFYDVTAHLEGSLAYTLEPGDIVLVTYPRFGFQNGKPLMVVSVKAVLDSSRVELVLWGAGPQPEDFA